MELDDRVSVSSTEVEEHQSEQGPLPATQHAEVSDLVANSIEDDDAHITQEWGASALYT